MHSYGTHSTKDAPPQRSFECVLLAGALTPSPLRQSLNIPVLCLPMTAKCHLLDLWLTALERQPGCTGVKIVVSSQADARRVKDAVEQRASTIANSSASPIVDVQVDTHEFRGPAGRIRDISDGLSMTEDTVMLVGEASCLPPASIAPLVEGLTDDIDGFVGTSEAHEPAGLYVFTDRAINIIPRIGFFDLKEQWLPALYERGLKVKAKQVVQKLHRIRDRTSYLEAVHRFAGLGDDATRPANANVSRSAHVCSRSLVAEDVSIGDGAIVQESIVMQGASIGGGAVVHKSIIGPHGAIDPRAKVCSSVVAPPAQERPVGAWPGKLRRKTTRTVKSMEG